MKDPQWVKRKVTETREVDGAPELRGSGRGQDGYLLSGEQYLATLRDDRPWRSAPGPDGSSTWSLLFYCWATTSSWRTASVTARNEIASRRVSISNRRLSGTGPSATRSRRHWRSGV